MSTEETVQQVAKGEMLAEISTGLVQLHSRHYGKGPTKAKTHMVNDTILCVLRGGFTTIERTLIESGEADSVYQMRRSFQDAMEEQFRGVVEDATGRNVSVFMSQVHVDPDLAVEFFLLEPLEQDPELAGPVEEQPEGAEPEIRGDGRPA
jgi:uncharacterized protein YbcI